MNQQDQRERFKEAILEKYPKVSWVTLSDGDFAVVHGFAKAGDYEHVGLRSAWEGFQLADNAALEVIAAKDAEIARLHKERDHYAIELTNSLEREYENRKALLASQEGA